MKHFVLYFVYLIIFFIFPKIEGFAQVNLVPNWSFEIIPDCNLGLGGVNFGAVPPWDSPTNGTPDPFNICNVGSISGGVPNNWWGYQMPHTGNGFVGAGFYNLIDNPPSH